MKQFFNIGKTVLNRAIGLQKNHSKTNFETISVVDEAASGCNKCKTKLLAKMYNEDSSERLELLSKCGSCPHKVMKESIIEKKIYVNDKNRYGYQPRLKINAIKLLLVLHHLAEADGYIFNATLNSLSKTLKCDKKTIKNNLNTLKHYNYILYSIEETGKINVFLPEVENYYKKAKEGGRGYLTVSFMCLNELLAINTINALRLAIRGLMEFDELNPKGFTGYEKSYKEIKYGLPKYCKKGIINTTLSKITLFDVVPDAHSVHFYIKPQFNAKEQKKLQLDYLEEFLTVFNKNFNLYINNFAEIEDNNALNFAESIPFVSNFNINEDAPMRMVLHSNEIKDLAKLITQFSLEEVMQTLAVIYNTYYTKGNRSEIKSLGALTRRLILNTGNESQTSIA